MDTSDTPLIQVSVAGTTIMLKENEAALVAYSSDCALWGITVELNIGYLIHTAQVIKRPSGNNIVCAAIFPRVQLNKDVEDRCKISYWTRTNPRAEKRITLTRGNIAEVELSK